MSGTGADTSPKRVSGALREVVGRESTGLRCGWGARQTHRMIVVQPVLETGAPDAFTLWPVAGLEPYTLLPLSGALGPAEVGAAVMAIAAYNDTDHPGCDGPPRPADALGAFLSGLSATDTPLAPGGLRVSDSATGATLVPGCCNGLEEWRDWLEVVDDDGDGVAGFGHDPSPLAERRGLQVRLTVDADQDGGPVIELPVAELRRLLAGVEGDLTGFLGAAADWAARQLPGHAHSVTAALAAALDLPAPGVPSKPQARGAVDGRRAAAEDAGSRS